MITGYTITYESQTETDSGKVLVGANERQKILTNLQEYVNYNITVFASTEKGNGPGSDLIIVRTDQDGKFSMLLSTIPDFCIKLLYLIFPYSWRSEIWLDITHLLLMCHQKGYPCSCHTFQLL